MLSATSRVFPDCNHEPAAAPHDGYRVLRHVALCRQRAQWGGRASSSHGGQLHPGGSEAVLTNGKLKHTERGMPIQSNLRKRISLFCAGECEQQREGESYGAGVQGYRASACYRVDGIT